MPFSPPKLRMVLYQKSLGSPFVTWPHGVSRKSGFSTKERSSYLGRHGSVPKPRVQIYFSLPGPITPTCATRSHGSCINRQFVCSHRCRVHTYTAIAQRNSRTGRHTNGTRLVSARAKGYSPRDARSRQSQNISYDIGVSCTSTLAKKVKVRVTCLRDKSRFRCTLHNFLCFIYTALYVLNSSPMIYTHPNSTLLFPLRVKDLWYTRPSAMRLILIARPIPNLHHHRKLVPARPFKLHSHCTGSAAPHLAPA